MYTDMRRTKITNELVHASDTGTLYNFCIIKEDNSSMSCGNSPVEFELEFVARPNWFGARDSPSL
jgi:hypothetical protein